MKTVVMCPVMATEFWDTVSGDHIRKEKERARALKKTHWWQNRLQQGICHYCSRTVGRDHLTMDHVVPLSRGGKSTRGNIVAACKECNNKKKYLLPLEWEEYLRHIADQSP